MYETEALKALGSFPLVQAALAILIVIGGYLALVRGNSHKNITPASNGGVVPQWLFMGPAHDAMQALHNIAEQSRRSNELQQRQIDLLERIADDSRQTTGLLELIRNESRLR